MQFFNVSLMKFLSSSFGKSLAFTIFVCHPASRLPTTLWISATTIFWTSFSWGDINKNLFIPDNTSITENEWFHQSSILITNEPFGIAYKTQSRCSYRTLGDPQTTKWSQSQAVIIADDFKETVVCLKAWRPTHS